MSVKLKSLAAFRRFLAEPGATIQLIRHDWAKEDAAHWQAFAARPGFFDPRKVKKLQTNGVCFTTPDGKGTWLYFRKASEFTFTDSDVVTVALNAEKGEVMEYRCWIETEGAKNG